MVQALAAIQFLSTPSARRATWFFTVDNKTELFLSTPSARRATHNTKREKEQTNYISIHALREEGDADSAGGDSVKPYFYPRPPRGGRLSLPRSTATAKLFLSTPSARRATLLACRTKSPSTYFYPRPPRGGRQAVQWNAVEVFNISIHALREEGDLVAAVGFQCHIEFLSTPSARRATRHAQACPVGPDDFYPRPPRGGRQRTLTKLEYTRLFLSTPSARRATAKSPARGDREGDFYPRPPRGGRRPCRRCPLPQGWISIHALREEGDCCACTPRRAIIYFYPRPPRGGRRLERQVIAGRRHQFLSTPSARRATRSLLRLWNRATDFYPRPPRGGRHCPSGRCTQTPEISIHALREEGDRPSRQRSAQP